MLNTMEFIKITRTSYNLKHTNYIFNPEKITFISVIDSIKNLELFTVTDNLGQTLQKSGIFKKYGSSDLLVDVNFKIEDGQFLKSILIFNPNN